MTMTMACGFKSEMANRFHPECALCSTGNECWESRGDAILRPVPRSIIDAGHRCVSRAGWRPLLLPWASWLKAHSFAVGVVPLTVIMTEFHVAEKTSVPLLPW